MEYISFSNRTVKETLEICKKFDKVTNLTVVNIIEKIFVCVNFILNRLNCHKYNCRKYNYFNLYRKSGEINNTTSAIVYCKNLRRPSVCIQMIGGPLLV